MEIRSRQEFRGNSKIILDQDEDDDEELMTEDDSEDDGYTNNPQMQNFEIPLEQARFDNQRPYIRENEGLNSRTPYTTEKKKLNNQINYDMNNIYWVLLAIITILAVVVAYFSFHSKLLPESIDFIFSRNQFREDYDCGDDEFILDQFKLIRKKFSSQDENTWITFASGIQRLFTTDPTEPAGFLLFHDSDDVTVKCLVKDVSEIAARCFKKATVFSINGESLNDDKYIKDSGEFIEQYKSEIIDKKVMIMYNLNDVPTNVAKVLHYIFDVYNPLVRESVNFVTLKKQLNVTSVNSKLINVVSNELKNLWKELEYNELDPLITRITTQLVVISKEKNLSC